MDGQQAREIEINFDKNKHGWIVLNLSIEDKLQKIKISYAELPFINMMEFLIDVNNNQPMSTFQIDEESKCATFIAGSIGSNTIRFMLFEGWYFTEQLFNIILNRKQFVREFTTKFQCFLRNTYDDESWTQYADSLKESDYEVYFRELLTDNK